MLRTSIPPALVKLQEEITQKTVEFLKNTENKIQQLPMGVVTFKEEDEPVCNWMIMDDRFGF